MVCFFSGTKLCIFIPSGPLKKKFEVKLTKLPINRVTSSAPFWLLVIISLLRVYRIYTVDVAHACWRRRQP
jgi:hypothetical protein